MSALPVAATALPIGIAFGFILERAGLGDPRVILGQFTFRDFTVVRVMFGTIITAMLLVVLGGALGWIDVGAIDMPPTDVGAQALGAVIFGGGFALAALCPGTACVAAASGRRDGVIAVAGVLAGSLLTPVLWPALGAAAQVPRERATLPVDLGVPVWVVVGAIVLGGVALSMAMRQYESRGNAPATWRLERMELGALAMAALFIAVDAPPTARLAPLAAIAAQIAREEDHIDPLELGAWIRDGHAGLRVLDVRDGLDSATYMIPGATAVPLGGIAALDVARDDRIVLYSDGGTHAAQAWVLLRARGVKNVWVLRDGMAAWEDEVLSPVAPTVAADSAQRRFRDAKALSIYFGGHPILSRKPASAPASSAPPAAKRRRNTC